MQSKVTLRVMPLLTEPFIAGPSRSYKHFVPTGLAEKPAPWHLLLIRFWRMVWR